MAIMELSVFSFSAIRTLLKTLRITPCTQALYWEKEISKTFEGKACKKSYHLGCSIVRRLRWKAMQSSPSDFDQVVACAPAFSFNNLTSWNCHLLLCTGTQGTATFLLLSVCPVISQGILKQFDEVHDVADSILESPDLCNYNPSKRICAPGQNSSRPTIAQANTIGSIYSPLHATDGSLI